MTDAADADSEEENDTDLEAEGGAEAADAEDEAERADAGDGPGRADAEDRADAADAGASDGDTSDEDAPDELVARIAATDEEAAAEFEALRRRVSDLEGELDEREATVADREETIEELESKLTRARADFQNYKRRAKEREEEIRERATEDLVERLLDVRDNLVRALEQDDDVEVRDGVEATLATFDRVLDAEHVSAIDPEVGGDVDPERHEVVHRMESDVPEGAIAEVYRPGYEMAGQVLRPAQVTVSEGEGGDESEGEGGDEDESKSERAPGSDGGSPGEESGGETDGS